jgi:hypothetical protein
MRPCSTGVLTIFRIEETIDVQSRQVLEGMQT